ncbi:acid protease [Patellaria atrata CBS 101060]|uniref:Probable aspartic-type endopeptidase OPSB n=1 Tax=Patellaria atrata CBS 101060 TaxID=1346257 RepID=A0A9P4S673_9PEZI|nr:acid protease [Patellaria atrata CBS 101060]
MRFAKQSVFAATLLGFLSCSEAIRLERRNFRKRQDTVSQELDNLEFLYFANCSMGTPAQELRLHIDTGSSDLWINAARSRLCRDITDPCAESGTYDANSSSTYEYVNSFFDISYVDGSGASGDYVRDTFHFGGASLTGLQFGIGYLSTSPEGILGIGYELNEVQVNRAGGDSYPNLPALLAEKGMIQSNAFSLWLNDLDANTGTILFGGVDTAKYIGQLQTLPIIPTQGFYIEFLIALTAMGQNGEEGSIFDGETIPVLLDSGASLSYVPDPLAEHIYGLYDAQFDPTQGVAVCDCSLGNSDDTLDFTFSGPTIRVPLNELVLEYGTTGFSTICILGIMPSGDSSNVLGDTFLRSAYVVYDLANNEISLAQTNFNASDSNILEIAEGTQGVPDATGVPNAVSTGSIPATGGGRLGGPTFHGSARPNPTSTTETSTGGAMAMITAAPALAALGAGLMFAL